MKILNDYNIASLSKMLYKTDIMPSGSSKSFIELSKKLILCFQEGYGLDKTKNVLSGELITTYGLSVNKKEIEEIAELVDTLERTVKVNH